MTARALLLSSLAACLLGAAATSCARAQEEPLILTPPLSEVFPLVPAPDGMRLKFPVLLNERTILRPDVLLRFIYLDPNARSRDMGGDDSGHGGGGGHGGHHHGGGGGGSDGGDADAAYSRDSGGGGAPGGAGGPGGNGPPGGGGDKGSQSELRTEVWKDTGLFRDALANATDTGTTFVYNFPGKTKPETASIDLPDGMLLGEVDGHVEILALANGSRSQQSGVQPGDRFVEIEQQPVATLRDFERVYPPVKEQAIKSGHSYAITVWRPAEGKQLTIPIVAPPSIPSFF
jgi:hypothetical protein